MKASTFPRFMLCAGEDEAGLYPSRCGGSRSQCTPSPLCRTVAPAATGTQPRLRYLPPLPPASLSLLSSFHILTVADCWHAPPTCRATRPHSAPQSCFVPSPGFPSHKYSCSPTPCYMQPPRSSLTAHRESSDARQPPSTYCASEPRPQLMPLLQYHLYRAPSHPTHTCLGPLEV